MLVEVLVSLAVGLLVAWVALVIALVFGARDRVRLTEILRLLPDAVRLLTSLARDGSLPRGVRVRLWLLLAYLAMPIDLVPDFVPVIGLADDAIIVALVLRSVVKRAGDDALTRHWPGTAEGLAALRRLTMGRQPPA